MNTDRITRAAKEIERMQRAVKWLEQYGPKVDDTAFADWANVKIHMTFAGSCDGAKELNEILSQLVNDRMKDLLEDAYEYCKEAIEGHRSAIQHEVSEKGVAQ